MAAQGIGPGGRLLSAVPRIGELAASAIAGRQRTLASPGVLDGSGTAGCCSLWSGALPRRRRVHVLGLGGQVAGRGHSSFRVSRVVLLGG